MYLGSYLYQYLVGGLIFALGVWLCLRNRDIRLERNDDRLFLAYAVLAFAGYAAVQGILNFVAAAP